MAGIALPVDDEELVGASTANMLTYTGFKVIEARSEGEALHLARWQDSADVAITDHLMPQMTDVDIVCAVAVEWPTLPVLIVSGYSDAIGIDA